MCAVCISIVIPCYNSPAEQIQRAFRSILSQTFTDYEIIIVDDGSDITHHDFLVELCKKSEKAKLLTQIKSGVSAARNYGAAEARGEFIAFLDSDDVVTEDFLERAHSVARETSSDFIIGGVKQVKDIISGEKLSRESECAIYTFENDRIADLMHHFIGPGYLIRYQDGYISRGPVARLIRSDVMRGCLFDETLQTGEDNVWNLSIMHRCRRISIVTETWYLYWINANSVTHCFDSGLFKKHLAMLESIANCVNLEEEKNYLSYVDRIYESMYEIWKYYLIKEPDSHKVDCIKRIIYSTHPWNNFGEIRYLRLARIKKKIISMAYRCHLLFLLFRIKERMNSKW